MSLNHVGTQFIDTDRLILRKFKLSDSEQMYNNWAKDPENVKYVTWRSHRSIKETRKVVYEWVTGYEDLECYRWAITIKNDGLLIGEISVIELSEVNECCEVGYILSKKYWNMGFMTEALHGVLRFLFEQVRFHRIQLRHDVNNFASRRVIEKNGLKHEGIIRHSRKTNTGSWCDTSLYSILRFEFKTDCKDVTLYC